MDNRESLRRDRSPTIVAAGPALPVAARRLDAAWLVFGVALVSYGLIGWVGIYVLDMFNYDGLARVQQAFGVLYNRDPHLAALGFIWMPLPALSNLPLILILKPLGLVLWTGALMTTIYTAFGMAQLYEILTLVEVPLRWRITWLVLFGAHPLIVQDAAYGLSEAPMMAFLFFSLKGFLLWERGGHKTGLHWAGIGAALAILCRYEALAWVGAGAVFIVLRLSAKLRASQGAVLEANLLTFLITPVYAVMLWVFMNWQIMGNPIHFLVGPGSTATTPDTAQTVGPTHLFAYAQSSFGGSASLMLREIGDFGPLLVVATVLLVCLIVVKRNWLDLGYLALAWSVLGFTYITAWRGLLPYLLRYFFWIVPGGVLVAALAQRYLKTRWLRESALAGISLLMLAPVVWLPARALPIIEDPYPQRLVAAFLMPPETTSYSALHGRIEEFRAVAEYLNAQPPGKQTLIDVTVGGDIAFFMDHPNTLVTSPDRDFVKILYAPVGKVDQILVAYPNFDTRGRSEIFKVYPDLYAGAPWLEPVHEFQGPNAWRLYKVRNNP